MKIREQDAADNQWKTATAKEKEYSVEYKFREEQPQGISMSEYPYLISILWKYEGDSETGLPGEADDLSQAKLENVLKNMDNTEKGVLMVAVKGNSRREWILYVSDPENWLKNLHMALKDQPAYPLEIHQYEEPEWNIWNKLTNAFG